MGRNGGGGLRQSGGETVQLVIDYVKQETLDPLKGLGRFLAFGIAGSLSLCVGVVLLLVAVLRLLQTETGAFAGNLSWLPYLIVGVLAVVVIALAAWRVARGPAARRRPADDEGRAG
ncbi:MAG: phage holin family protein [Acidimicrobiales bacterium]